MNTLAPSLVTAKSAFENDDIQGIRQSVDNLANEPSKPLDQFDLRQYELDLQQYLIDLQTNDPAVITRLNLFEASREKIVCRLKDCVTLEQIRMELISGDAARRNAAARKIWDQFGVRLKNFAQEHMWAAIIGKPIDRDAVESLVGWAAQQSSGGHCWTQLSENWLHLRPHSQRMEERMAH